MFWPTDTRQKQYKKNQRRLNVEWMVVKVSQSKEKDTHSSLNLAHHLRGKQVPVLPLTQSQLVKWNAFPMIRLKILSAFKAAQKCYLRWHSHKEYLEY